MLVLALSTLCMCMYMYREFVSPPATSLTHTYIHYMRDLQSYSTV